MSRNYYVFHLLGYGCMGSGIGVWLGTRDSINSIPLFCLAIFFQLVWVGWRVNEGFEIRG